MSAFPIRELLEKGEKEIIMHSKKKSSGEIKQNEKEVPVIENPKICLFDFAEDDVAKLKAQGFQIFSASLGNEIKVPKKYEYHEHLCLLNYIFPYNFHEYDVVVINFPKKNPIEYAMEENTREINTNFEDSYFLSKFPQTLFDPKPLASFLIRKDINNLLNRKSILIVFANKEYSCDYIMVKKPSNEHIPHKCNIYDFCKEIPVSKNKRGHDVNIVIKHDELRNILEKYKNSINYQVTFYHPTKWNVVKQKDESIPGFFPLMTDIEGDIISFLYFLNGSLILVFPEMDNKIDILDCLLNSILPAFEPEIFPFSTAFKWKEQEEYYLPNHSLLLETKEKIKAEYEQKITKIDEKISANRAEFKYLHDLICESDEVLVLSVVEFLKWLGFENVKLMDEEAKTIKEEDIQIETSKGLLVIEVKGIGGTSKDGDCSQIAKIVHRREKERKKFDVHGIYIVNHQRYLPPLKRKNPPFSENQLKDAIEDDRGLLTTWELFKLYNLIEKQIISKEDAIDRFYENGLISFNPKNFLGKIEKIFKDGSVFILDIKNYELNIGDNLVIYKDDECSKVKIINLQVNDKDVEKAANEEVGIEIDSKIKKNSEVFKI